MSSDDRRGEVTGLLAAWSRGDTSARDRLIPLVYDELHRCAAAYLRRERKDHTLQPTALVHEAFVRLVDDKSPSFQNRRHFFGIAARLMRQILVDHARARQAGKRGHGLAKLPLDEGRLLSPERSDDIVALDEALTSLAALDPKQVELVELRFFGGLSIEETASALGVSAATVKRDWKLARAFLHREIQRPAAEGAATGD